MHGERVGVLERCEEGCLLTYDPEVAAEGLQSNRALISLTLPPRLAPYGPRPTRTYLEGLLPQGRRRRRLARELGLDPGDCFGLIAELGGDCIGAVTFGPEGEEVEEGEERDPETLAWASEEVLAEVLRPQRGGELFDPDDRLRMRFALPGQRHKLALVRDEENDRWAWPEPGVPSTHIVKPEPADRPGFAALEAACTGAYREAGLPAAHAEVTEIAGVECLLSKRFDRWGEGPLVECLHQESLAQALGIPPDAARGRLAAGVPSLTESCGLLRALGEPQAAKALMHATFCDLTLGNTRLRPANAALLHTEDQAPILAPFFAIHSTEIYGEVRPRHTIVGDDVPPAPFLVDLVTTVDQFDFHRQDSVIEAVRMMGEVCRPLSAIAERAQQEGWYRREIDEAYMLASNRAVEFFEKEARYLRGEG
jgi:serine/threonine-protein kinase HipA